ncbi:MAG: hypothetical protein CME64_00465 [Halobacteriovoraceae bacterium]|nr:hypothetical protein [Halobacteriovoraceae bacterium]|tara:strand:- start:111247 stop:111873 length:627 start_codon:yes stop_codon:yes gene_type:complete
MKFLALNVALLFSLSAMAQENEIAVEKKGETTTYEKSEISYGEKEKPITGFELRQMAREKNISLTEEEKEILEIGEISTTRYVVGGVLGTYPLGLGIGHAIQGTWSHKGWIFTAGELASLAVFAGGISSCFDGDCGSANLGAVAFVGFRIWEIVDVWAGVPSYEKQYKEMKGFILNKGPKKSEEVTFNFAPIYNSNLNAPGLGFGLRF